MTWCSCNLSLSLSVEVAPNFNFFLVSKDPLSLVAALTSVLTDASRLNFVLLLWSVYTLLLLHIYQHTFECLILLKYSHMHFIALSENSF